MRANAQRIRASANVVHASKESDLKTLGGIRVDALTSTGASSVVMRYGLTVVGRGGRSFKSTCVGGPYLPGQCPPEPVAERRYLAFVSAGIGAQTRPRLLGAAIFIDGLAGVGSIMDRGVSTGKKISESRPLVGISTGGEVRLHPSSSRFELYAGWDAAAVHPFVDDCVDCLIPFNGNFTFQRWHVGIGLGRKRVR